VFLLNSTIEKARSMVPFSFNDIFVNEKPLDVKKVSFWKKMEILYGLTYSDLFLKDPVITSQALTQTEDIKN
jgi:hypothetical protein